MTPRWKRIPVDGIVAELIMRSPKLAHGKPKSLAMANRSFAMSQGDKNCFGDRVSELTEFDWHPHLPAFGEVQVFNDAVVFPLKSSIAIDRLAKQAQGKWVFVKGWSAEAKMVFTLYAKEEGDVILFDLLA